MAYVLADVEALVRLWARNAVDSSEYSPAQIQSVVQLAGEHWCRSARTLRETITLTTTVGSDTVTGLAGDVLPEHILAAFLTLSGQIVDPDIDVVDYIELLELQALRTGAPHTIAFSDAATIKLDTLADRAYTLNLRRWKPFVVTTGYNLPDEQMRIIARFGAPAYLQLTEAANEGFAKDCMALFEQEIRRFAGRNAGGLGGSVSVRQRGD